MVLGALKPTDSSRFRIPRKSSFTLADQASAKLKEEVSTDQLSGVDPEFLGVLRRTSVKKALAREELTKSTTSTDADLATSVGTQESEGKRVLSKIDSEPLFETMEEVKRTDSIRKPRPKPINMDEPLFGTLDELKSLAKTD